MSNPEAIQQIQSTDTSGRLSIGTKISYGLGDFASNMSWQLVTAFLTFYYTDVFGLSAAIVATLLLVARGWDAVLDPVIGLVMERTHSKYGRFRPYILYGGPLLAIFNILTFHVPSFEGTTKIVYAFIVYMLLNTVYSLVNVPYGALATVMTRNPDERTSLSSYRMLFTTIASIVIGGATMPLLQSLGGGDNAKGFFYTAVLYSVCAVPLFYLVFRNCKEVIMPAKTEKPTLKESLVSVISNLPLACSLGTIFFVFMSLFGRMSILIYYYIYVLNRPDLIGILMMLFGACQVAGTLTVNAIAEKFEKKTLTMFGAGCSGIGVLVIFFTNFSNIPVIFAGTVVWGFFMGMTTPMLISTAADCIEYGEWKSGARADGAIYAALNLIMKFAMTVVGAGSMIALGYIGYIPNAAQNAQTIAGLNTLANLVPAVSLFLAVASMLFYSISKEKFRMIVQEITERKKVASH